MLNGVLLQDLARCASSRFIDIVISKSNVRVHRYSTLYGFTSRMLVTHVCVCHGVCVLEGTLYFL